MVCGCIHLSEHPSTQFHLAGTMCNEGTCACEMYCNKINNIFTNIKQTNLHLFYIKHLEMFQELYFCYTE